MTDLSHWVFAEDFTAHEAAYLILGVDPSTDTSSRSIQHVLKRISDAYAATLENLKFQFFIEPYLSESRFDEGEGGGGAVSRKETLFSIEIEKLSDAFSEGDEVSTIGWLEQGRTDLTEQRFSRAELLRWIDDNQLISMYSFARSTPLEPQEKSSPPMEKVLSNRERETLLTIIAVLCNEAKLDHSKHAKTAGLIHSTAAKMGLSIGESTIEGHLKKIPNALAGRMK